MIFYDLGDGNQRVQGTVLWRQQGPLNQWDSITLLHGIRTQKTMT